MRILFTAPNLPYPATSGGAQRTARLLESLQRFADVDCFFIPAKAPSPSEFLELEAHASILGTDATDRIRREHSSSIISKLGKSIQTYWQGERHRWVPCRSAIAKLPPLGDYDLVVSRYLAPACMLDLFRHPRLLIDVDDYDPDRLEMRIRSAAWLKNLTLKRCLRHSVQAHSNLIPKVQHAWISNENDRQYAGLSRATLLPNLPYFDGGLLPKVSAPNLKSQKFIMVGTFDYSANVLGADLFIRDAWPQIIQKFPAAELILIGRNMSKQQKLRWGQNKGVQALGFVKDLSEHYASCIASISPIITGAGTNIKVLESAAYGRVPILTKTAHRGFENHFINKHSSLIADDISGMADPCIEVLSAKEEAINLGSQARKVIEANYTIDNFHAIVRKDCTQAHQNKDFILKYSAAL